jgi:hypothetical protein
MSTNNIADKLAERLFDTAGNGVFAVLDGASVHGLLDMLFQWRPPHECLHPGELAPDMAEVAPYLVQLERGSRFTDWVITQGWGNHWGVFVISPADLRTLRRHLRAAFIVRDESGRPMYFRFYDPRVLRTYIPTCTPEEMSAFFGPIRTFFAEGEEPDAILCFRAPPQGPASA